MEYIYAALLLHKLKQEITEDNIKNVIKSTGVTPNEVMVKALVAAMSEVNIDEAIKAAPTMMAAAPAAAPAGGAAEQKPAAAPAEDKKKKAEEEKAKEEAALEGLGALFG